MFSEYPRMSEDHYPTEETLEAIRSWPIERIPELMEFLKKAWWNPEWGWRQEGDTYYVSTGGWSGNESLIEALRSNAMMWRCLMKCERRGGHYEFESIIK